MGQKSEKLVSKKRGMHSTKLHSVEALVQSIYKTHKGFQGPLIKINI
ncbi:hypothetical protein HCUR_00706 [Holospora curviuscula]|uniref:Uncharacterized protein n=1 Tax=Holospora curviuscula TaxID=1082868 RepID=A0A2S5R9C5_9PROT|nr:hypothetical protein HCUR_00706 [Holospora curviuscula]